MKSLRPILSLAAAVLVAPGCTKKDAAPAATGTRAEAAPPAHEHHAPHGGTAVALGDELYHLEFVLDASTGKLSAYVLDGEMENFIRSAMPAFEVFAKLDGEKRPLTFRAVADRATGETVGDTSLFEAQADWLKTTKEFDGVILRVVIRGSTFSDVDFNFPRGNEKAEQTPATDHRGGEKSGK